MRRRSTMLLFTFLLLSLTLAMKRGAPPNDKELESSKRLRSESSSQPDLPAEPLSFSIIPPEVVVHNMCPHMGAYSRISLSMTSKTLNGNLHKHYRAEGSPPFWSIDSLVETMRSISGTVNETKKHLEKINEDLSKEGDLEMDIETLKMQKERLEDRLKTLEFPGRVVRRLIFRYVKMLEPSDDTNPIEAINRDMLKQVLSLECALTAFSSNCDIPNVDRLLQAYSRHAKQKVFPSVTIVERFDPKFLAEFLGKISCSPQFLSRFLCGIVRLQKIDLLPIVKFAENGLDENIQRLFKANGSAVDLGLKEPVSTWFMVLAICLVDPATLREFLLRFEPTVYTEPMVIASYMLLMNSELSRLDTLKVSLRSAMKTVPDNMKYVLLHLTHSKFDSDTVESLLNSTFCCIDKCQKHTAAIEIESWEGIDIETLQMLPLIIVLKRNPSTEFQANLSGLLYVNTIVPEYAYALAAYYNGFDIWFLRAVWHDTFSGIGEAVHDQFPPQFLPEMKRFFITSFLSSNEITTRQFIQENGEVNQEELDLAFDLFEVFTLPQKFYKYFITMFPDRFLAAFFERIVRCDTTENEAIACSLLTFSWQDKKVETCKVLAKMLNDDKLHLALLKFYPQNLHERIRTLLMGDAEEEEARVEELPDNQ